MRIGILTGGGDAPGLNAAIRAIVRKGTAVHGAEMLGFRNGWRGVMDGDVRELTKESVQGIFHRGGTILGSSGADPYHEGGTAKVRRMFADLALDGLIAVGGEGTLGAAAHMTEEGLPVVGVPKTIDNDLSGTDACIGFSTAVQTAWRWRPSLNGRPWGRAPPPARARVAAASQRPAPLHVPEDSHPRLMAGPQLDLGRDQVGDAAEAREPWFVDPQGLAARGTLAEVA